MTHKREGFIIVANTEKPAALRVAEEIRQWLSAHDQVVVEESDPEKMFAHYVISLGGDGTAIHTAAEYSICGVITIPINVDGGVGFVTIGNIKNWRKVLERIISGKYEVEKRIGLELHYKGEMFGPFANDVLLKHTASMASFKLVTNGHTVYRKVMADGFIIAAPTGSTGYNMSARGPVCEPGLECILATAMNPDQFNVVPIAFRPSTVITMEVVDSKPSGVVNVIADGQTIGTIETGESVIIKQHEARLLFAVIDSKGFYTALRTKKGLAH